MYFKSVQDKGNVKLQGLRHKIECGQLQDMEKTNLYVANKTLGALPMFDWEKCIFLLNQS